MDKQPSVLVFILRILELYAFILLILPLDLLPLKLRKRRNLKSNLFCKKNNLIEAFDDGQIIYLQFKTLISIIIKTNARSEH